MNVAAPDGICGAGGWWRPAVVAALPQQVHHPTRQIANACSRSTVGDGRLDRRKRHAGQLDLLRWAYGDRAE